MWGGGGNYLAILSANNLTKFHVIFLRINNDEPTKFGSDINWEINEKMIISEAEQLLFIFQGIIMIYII